MPVTLPDDLTTPVELPGKSGQVFIVKLLKDRRNVGMVYGSKEDMDAKSYGFTHMFHIWLYDDAETAKKRARMWLSSYPTATQAVERHLLALVERFFAR